MKKVLLIVVLLWSCSGWAAAPEDRILQDLRMEQPLGQALNLSEQVTDEAGVTRSLKDAMAGRPTILVFVYHECPMLCGEVLAGLSRALASMKLRMGTDYQLLALSLNASDTSASAAKKKSSMGAVFEHAKFLVASDASIHALTQAAGYTFEQDRSTGQIAHPSGFYILTPEGKISKVVYGIEYNGRDVRLALVEAARGKIGTFADRLLLLCFHYDPKQGRYGVAIDRVVKTAAVSTALSLGIWIIRNRRHEG